MKTEQLLTDLEFHDAKPYAQPLLVDQYSRIIRWIFKPGQQIGAHKVPDSPFYIVVIKGRGIFTGHDGIEQEIGPNSLILFEPGETHSVTALDEGLVFLSFMQSVETMRPNRTGGELGRSKA